MFWQDLREEEFEEAIRRSKGVCILPVGCLETHGQLKRIKQQEI